MKLLFRVMSSVGLVGSFEKKFHALNAMRSYNRKLRPGERPTWMTHGPDHWRAKTDSRIPKRPSEPVWGKKDGEPVLTYVPCAVYWASEAP